MRIASHKSRRFKFRFNWVNTVIFLLIIIIIGSSFYLYTLLSGNSNPLSPPRGEEVIEIRKEEKPLLKWWDMNWKSAYQLKVENPTYEEALITEYAQITINHKGLVADKKAKEKGEDLRLIFQDEENSFKEIDFLLESENTEDALISFKLAESLPKRYASFRYFLYFNNSSTSENTFLQEKPLLPIKSALNTEIESEQNPVFTTKIDRKWFLKGDDLPPAYRNISAKVDVNPEYKYEDRAMQYSVLNTKLTQQAVIVKQNAANFNLDVSTLEPGTYKLSIKIDTYEENFEFKVSYPLYATWTMDWEGYDVKDEYLAMMDKHANDNGMPITHFFNPRIYVTSTIPKARSKYLTDWVKARKLSRGDEISMHLHMHYDFVEMAGVTRRTEVSWNTPSNDGYEVLTANYTPEEFEKIVSLGLQKFKENGLENPVGYRAGGWFMNLDNLKVLPKLGFKYDSSGRDAYVFGKNKIKGFWNLKATTQPYKISQNNQNSSTPPTIDLWEFPDNGADSTNQQTSVAIGKFNENFKGDPLKQKQVITFLSHPHWFNTDNPRMEELFKYLDQFKAEKGNGPVVYTTLEKSYEVYTGKN